VDEADIYIGIYAWRYGHVPAWHDVSITVSATCGPSA